MTDDLTPTKEQEFKQRFVSILKDLQQNGIADGEAMAMVGTLADDIAKSLNQTSWSGAKSTLTADAYDELLGSFQRQGNALHRDGKGKQAYAVQLLAYSLVAGTQRRDLDMAQGETLLDALIDQAAARSRNLPPRRTN